VRVAKDGPGARAAGPGDTGAAAQGGPVPVPPDSDGSGTRIGVTLTTLSREEACGVSHDELTFDEFVAASAGRLLRTAVFLVYDRHQAEDLLQITYERVARRWPRILRGGDRPEAYARKVLVNLAIDHGKKRRDVPVGGVGDVDRLAGARQAWEIPRTPLDDVLAALPVKQRAVVVLRYWCDLTESEIAEELGISRGTVKSHTARAMTALRRQLAEEAVHE
jgi:RNA polymerase sigma-70 factor (sigma-E family)